MLRGWALLVALGLAIPASGAADPWRAGPDAEPSTPFDTDLVMWEGPTDTEQDRVYFSGHLALWPLPGLTVEHDLAARVVSPAIAYLEAYLGYWRDCNGDGAIGDLRTGSETYLSIDTELGPCPIGSPYYDGIEVKEFRWIGRNAHDGQGPFATALGPVGARGDPRDVSDPETKVWADWGNPAGDPIGEPTIWPLPTGTADDTDGHFAYIDGLTLGGMARAAPGIWPTTPSGERNPESPVPNVPNPITRTARDRYNDSSDGTGGRPVVRPWSWGTPVQPDCRLSPQAAASSIDLGGSLFPTIDHAYRSAAHGCSRSNADKFPVYPNMEAKAPGTVKVQTDWSFFFFPATRFNPSELQPGTPDVELCPGIERWESVNDGCNAGWFARDHGVMTPAPFPGGNAVLDVWITFYAATSVPSGSELPAGVQDPFLYGAEACQHPQHPRWSCDPDEWEAAMSGLGREWKAIVGEPYDLRDVDLIERLLPES